MPSEIFPTDAEVASLVPAPGSLVWRIAGDTRLLFGAGYALLLQVSHPTVGAGVAEYSDFRTDPWGRLMRTLDYVNLMVYGGPEQAAETGRRVREFHKRIKGRLPSGEPYHALEPEAYAWVQATLAEGIVAGHARFGVPLSRAEKEGLWEGWRRLSRLVGVRERDLPEGWDAFLAYRDRMAAERLENTEAVKIVLGSFRTAAPPPVPLMRDPLWRAARLPIARAFELTTSGLLGPELRDRFELRWTRADEAAFRSLGALSRATTPVLPDPVRVLGPHHLRMRSKQIARGDVAGEISAANAARHAAARV